MQTAPGVASSRQESQAAPGAACSCQESPAVIRMKRFCLEFFFLYTKSFLVFFICFLCLHYFYRQIFYPKRKHIQFQLSLDMYIYVLVYTKFRGEVNKSRATQHIAPHMHAHIRSIASCMCVGIYDICMTNTLLPLLNTYVPVRLRRCCYESNFFKVLISAISYLIKFVNFFSVKRV